MDLETIAGPIISINSFFNSRSIVLWTYLELTEGLPEKCR